MKVLLVAPWSDRDDVGEAWIGYQWVSRLAEVHDVTVLGFRKHHGRSLAHQVPGARVVEWEEPPLVGRYERLNSMLKPASILFNWSARRWIRRALKAGERFDVAHQVVPVSLRYPSPLRKLGIPYLIGPVGGNLTSPPGFVKEEGGAPWFTTLRVLDGFRLRWSPSLRSTFEDASLVIGIADYVRDLLQGLRIREFRVLNDTGVDELPTQAEGSVRTDGVRLLFVGRVVRTKGLRDVIRAMGQLPAGRVTLDVLGEGYDRTACEALVAELGLQGVVRFHGRIPHAEVAGFYVAADVFVFPSYREAGGIAVVEAMSHGLPVIVCDRGGPASSVEDSSGIRLPAVDPEQLSDELARAIERLAADPAQRKAMGRAARERVASTFLWDKRVEVLSDLYREVIDNSGGR